MNNGLYISTTSLLLNQKRMEVISNNLANGNTTGFKKDIVLAESFPEVLLSKINGGIDMDNHGPFKGVKVEQNGDVFTLSIDSGYFKVKTPAGVSHSRDLRFTIDQDGYLKTLYKNTNDAIKTDGENYVLGKQGPIRVEDRNIEIDKNGNLLSNGQIVDNLITFTPLHVIGTTSGGVRLDKIVTDFTQGSLMETGNNLDFALKGDGLFKVQTNQGPMYTRDGSFSLNEYGELITTEGHLVLGQYGSIALTGENFTINNSGEIIQNGNVVDRLDIVNVNNKEYLRKQGDNLYKLLDGVEAEEVPFNGQVLRGYLENSNIDTIKEMVNMITLMRNYETSQKMIKSQDELLEKAVTEIGRV